MTVFDDGDAVQDQLDLGVLRRVDHDLAVGEGAREDIVACGGDGDGAAVDPNAAVVADRAAVAERNGDGVRLGVGDGDGGAEGSETQNGEAALRRGGGAAGAEQRRGESGAQHAGKNFMIETHDAYSFQSSLCSVDCSPSEISKLPLRQRSSSIMAFSSPLRLSVS